MSTKHKMTKHEQNVKDEAENRRFLTILAISTVVLMLILYFVLAN